MNVFIILAVSGILAMMAGVHGKKSLGLPVVLTACLLALAAIYVPWPGDYSEYLHQMLVFDSVSYSFSSIMVFLSIGIFVLSYYYYPAGIEHQSDIYSLFVFSLSGAFLLVSFHHLVMLFLGAEIMSIPLYVLAASNRKNLLSNEAGLKYYLMGSFATCFLLLGITLMYGAAGTYDLKEIHDFIVREGVDVPMFSIGMTLVLGALLFKLSAVPFHFWAPDVYEGSPTVLTAFVSTVVKIAVVGAIVRLISILNLPVGSSESVMEEIAFYSTPWFWLLVLASAASMIFGSIAALQQTELKRFLAYTGIFNAGFVLVPVLSGPSDHSRIILYYLVGYGVASILCFTIYAEIKKITGENSIKSLQGLLYKNKAAGIAMIFCLLSFTGIPPLAGFWGKFGILSAGLSSHLLPLVVCAIVASLIGAYNYLSLVIRIATPESDQDASYSLHPVFTVWILFGALLLLGIGLTPEFFQQLI
ncbi:MAG: NADH-quinone oxidoreductase subunit N [Saprospiraceae bacterium]|jgi:NADH-quinone oxidoreductase subunit N|nr:NADH-quinone oxidoreductase subunit N [Saprospiraceae bacterium]